MQGCFGVAEGFFQGVFRVVNAILGSRAETIKSLNVAIVVRLILQDYDVDAGEDRGYEEDDDED